MLKVGLTGGIGSGKSTVSQFLKEENIPIVDADIIAREVLTLYPEILQEIKSNFGEEFVDDKKGLDRKKLGKYIFESSERRLQLEAIMIPFIKKEIFKRLWQYNESDEAICIVDGATLIEHGLHEAMDKNILVISDEAKQIERVSKRDGLKEEEIKFRIASQLSLLEKKDKVDYVIDNNGSLEETKEQLLEILKTLRDIRHNSKL